MPTPRTGNPVGRPRQFETQLSLRLTPEQAKAMRSIQRANGIGKGEALRILLDKGISA